MRAKCCALSKFHVTNSQTTRDQIKSDTSDRDLIKLCAFLSFLEEVQMNSAYIHATNT